MCRLPYATCHDAGYANIGRPAASSCAFSGAIASRVSRPIFTTQAHTAPFRAMRSLIR
jgi:hypothetical protein